MEKESTHRFQDRIVKLQIPNVHRPLNGLSAGLRVVFVVVAAARHRGGCRFRSHRHVDQARATGSYRGLLPGRRCAGGGPRARPGRVVAVARSPFDNGDGGGGHVSEKVGAPSLDSGSDGPNTLVYSVTSATSIDTHTHLVNKAWGRKVVFVGLRTRLDSELVTLYVIFFCRRWNKTHRSCQVLATRHSTVVVVRPNVAIAVLSTVLCGSKRPRGKPEPSEIAQYMSEQAVVDAESRRNRRYLKGASDDMKASRVATKTSNA